MAEVIEFADFVVFMPLCGHRKGIQDWKSKSGYRVFAINDEKILLREK